MRHAAKFFFLAAALLLAPAACRRLSVPPTEASRDASSEPACAPKPHNVLLFIGDGMGAAQIEAGRDYVHGRAGRFGFEKLPAQGQVQTRSADDFVTDSAAGATAMATGKKVGNGVLALNIPGDGKPLRTILEMYRDEGKATGLVTTTFITHATPAAFAVHEPNRSLYERIAEDLEGAGVTLLLGGAAYVTPEAAKKSGYEVATNAAELKVLAPTAARLWGLFGRNHLPYEKDGAGDLPHLHEMTQAALAILEKDPDGFFLMVEGGRIDHASHANDIGRLVLEMAEFARAVAVGIAWAKAHADTLLLVTADHETGGLKVLKNKGPGEVPEVNWSTEHHTGVPIPIYGMGPNSELVRGTIDNTEIFRIMGGCPLPTPH